LNTSPDWSLSGFTVYHDQKRNGFGFS
jgi:hypothetical protein